jgi:hypothetical protein
MKHTGLNLLNDYYFISGALGRIIVKFLLERMFKEVVMAYFKVLF